MKGDDKKEDVRVEGARVITVWSGGDCPVPETTPVDVLWRDGSTHRSLMAGGWRWEHDNDSSDIVGYTILSADDLSETGSTVENGGSANRHPLPEANLSRAEIFIWTVLQEVVAERLAQDKQHGADRNLEPESWLRIIGEEYGEACEAANEMYAGFDETTRDMRLCDLREELIQVAAVAVAAVECIDRDKWQDPFGVAVDEVHEKLVAAARAVVEATGGFPGTGPLAKAIDAMRPLVPPEPGTQVPVEADDA